MREEYMSVGYDINDINDIALIDARKRNFFLSISSHFEPRNPVKGNVRRKEWIDTNEGKRDAEREKDG